MKIKRPSPSLVVSIIALVMATTGTAVAAVNYARNSGAVDGKSAVRARATLAQAAGKLVATERGGPDKGRIPGKFVADVVRGGSGTFGANLEVADNQAGAPTVLSGVPGLGTLTASCNDQNDRAGSEDPAVTVSFANQAGAVVNLARRVGNGEGTVLALQAGAVDTFTIGRSNDFEIHIERNRLNLRIQGVVRQDTSRGAPAANCVIYGFALRV